MIKTLLVILCFGVTAYTQTELPKEFKTLLKECKMTFELPKNFELKKECNDTLALSDICFKHRDKNLEIRIDIEPISEKSKKYPVLGLYDEGSFNSIALEPGLYNATEAGSGSFKISDKYNIGYKECWMIYMFKSKTAVAHVFIFLDKNDLTDKEFDSLFLALKFK